MSSTYTYFTKERRQTVEYIKPVVRYEASSISLDDSAVIAACVLATQSYLLSLDLHLPSRLCYCSVARHLISILLT